MQANFQIFSCEVLTVLLVILMTAIQGCGGGTELGGSNGKKQAPEKEEPAPKKKTKKDPPEQDVTIEAEVDLTSEAKDVPEVEEVPEPTAPAPEKIEPITMQAVYSAFNMTVERADQRDNGHAPAQFGQGTDFTRYDTITVENASGWLVCSTTGYCGMDCPKQSRIDFRDVNGRALLTPNGDLSIGHMFRVPAGAVSAFIGFSDERGMYHDNRGDTCTISLTLSHSGG